MSLSIRQACVKDLPNIRELFYNTINAVNSRDYTSRQVEVWSAFRDEEALWNNRLQTQYFVVAEQAGQLVGFSSVTADGYLDLIFVHRDHQGKGIAAALLMNIEIYADNKRLKMVTTHASITAKPFFEKKGFAVIKQQTVNVKGVELTNFVMQKEWI